jgi:hypothetical protein
MWFTETAWPPIIILCIVGVLLFLGWMSQRRIGYLAGVLLCLGLCGGVWLIERRIVTEREIVEQRLLDFTRTFQRESLQRGVANLLLGGPEPETFAFISASANDVRELAKQALDLVDIQDDVRISDVHTTLTNNNSRAIMQFRASASVNVATLGNAGRQPTRWELTWQRESGVWKVTHATRLNFMSGQPLSSPLTAKE